MMLRYDKLIDVRPSSKFANGDGYDHQRQRRETSREI